jgi:peptidoglycan/LPS O-acetylase OafA/YrhL
MSRIAFALLVPLLVLVIAGILAVDIVMLGFASESCRAHDGRQLNWSAGGEAAIVQLIFGIGFALALGILSVVLARNAALRSLRRSVEGFAIAGFLSLAVALVIGVAACSMTPYAGIGKALFVLGPIFLAVAAVQLIRAYFGALRSPA